VTATMTWVGLDVHARSTHAAAIDRNSGELTRARFGAGADPVVGWLRELPQPVHACYEAGPTGYALYRAAEAAGVRIDVVAPSKTPRAAADRIKTDRKDAELLVRLLLAGSLTPVAVPPASFEAARDLARAREQVRADLARLRHRISKLLLRYGRVYDGGGTWTQAHRRWLSGQRFEHVPTELAYLDALAAIDGLLARRAALDERLSLLATEPDYWPTVARLRCFRGIETLSALVLHLEVGDFHRFQRPGQLAAWLGLVPSLHQSGESETRGSDHQDRLRLRAPDPRRGRLALPARAADRRHLTRPALRPTRPRPPDRLASPAPPLPTTATAARTRQARQHRRRRRRARARLLPLVGSRGRLTPTCTRPR